MRIKGSVDSMRISWIDRMCGKIMLHAIKGGKKSVILYHGGCVSYVKKGILSHGVLSELNNIIKSKWALIRAN